MTRRIVFPLLFMIGISVIPVLSIHVPRALSFLPLLFGLCLCFWWVLVEKQRLVYSKSYLAVVFGVCGMCALSVLWSLSPPEALERVLKVAGVLLFSIPLAFLCLSVRRGMLAPFMWLFPAGVSVAALLCAVELGFGLPLYNLIHGVGADDMVSTAVMNRGVVCVVLSYFVALFFVREAAVSSKVRVALLLAMTVSVLLMLGLTQSQSGQLAFLVGLLTLLLFPHRFESSYRVLALLIIGAMVLTPFIVDLLYIGLIERAQSIPWLKDGYAGNRVEIWYFVMHYALHNPLYGYGIEATRFVESFDHAYLYHRAATVLHPHNFSIQMWMEFGLLGVALSGVFFMLLTRKIGQMAAADRRVIMAVFLCVLTISSIGYGLWQGWWLGALVFLTALCCLMADHQEAA